VDLKEACTIWQSGREAGSSVVRGAARYLTGVPHYFQAHYIDEYERRAAAEPAMLSSARILLDAVADSNARTARSWCVYARAPISEFAGRGLVSRSEDAQIRAALDGGEIAMPLWGVSLGNDIALRYGSRFLLEITGRFHGVAAWRESGLKADEREMITGGRYAVEQIEDREGTTHAKLREIDVIRPVHSVS
jgi:hypothetical protein